MMPGMPRAIRFCCAGATRLSRQQKRVILLCLDVTAAMLALGLIAALHDFAVTVSTMLVIAAATACLSVALGLHRIKLHTYEADGILRSAVLAAGVALLLGAQMWRSGAIVPATAPLLFGMLFFLAAVALRAAVLQAVLLVLRHGKPRVPVVIYGAGDTGLQLAAALRRHETILPVAFLDDDPSLHGMTLAGLHVYPAAELGRIVSQRDVCRVILAMPALSQPRQMQIARRLQPHKLDVQTVPSFAQLIGQEALVDRLMPVVPARFLGRPPVEPPMAGGSAAYAGRSVLVTGAGGSIGSELCRQLIACRPARLTLFDVSEAALYAIDKDLRSLGVAGTEIVAVLGSVTDMRLVRATLARHGIDTLFHAAAYKHVPLVEQNPVVAIDNNVLGTRILAEAAVDANIERFILISSDKAVRPGNIMGATKRLAELVVQDLGHRAPMTRFSIVRFGNVLGSSGSVVPLFREQIARGGPITLTNDDVTRYFMTLAEAGRLLLLAGAFDEGPRLGADVFVLNMGRPIRIRDLAAQMIEAAGYTLRDSANPDGDIEIRTIGLRPGEKLHEELLIGHSLLPTPHPKILRAAEASLSEFEMAQALRQLHAAVAGQNADAARRLVFRWVEGASTPRVLAKA